MRGSCDLGEDLLDGVRYDALVLLDLLWNQTALLDSLHDCVGAKHCEGLTGTTLSIRQHCCIVAFKKRLHRRVSSLLKHLHLCCILV